MDWIIKTLGKVVVVLGVAFLVYGGLLHRARPVAVGAILIVVFIWPAFYRRGR